MFPLAAVRRPPSNVSPNGRSAWPAPTFRNERSRKPSSCCSIRSAAASVRSTTRSPLVSCGRCSPRAANRNRPSSAAAARSAPRMPCSPTATLVRVLDLNDYTIESGGLGGHPSDNIPVALALGEALRTAGPRNSRRDRHRLRDFRPRAGDDGFRVPTGTG